MLQAIEKAAKEAFLNNQVPWLLSAITDWSYEEGNAQKFKSYIDLFQETGTSPLIINGMQLGINGWLMESFESNGLNVTARKKSHGHDFTLQETKSKLTADVESKLSFDCTSGKYYREIAGDRKKLLASSARHAFQLVFIVSLPNYDYPEGVWNGVHCKSRRVANLGHEAQWQTIRKYIPFDTAFTDGRPVKMPFDHEAKAAAAKHMEGFYQRVFRPDSPWQFDPDLHLRNAAVGIALWQCR